jgi:type VI secretion system FHA domain protein
MLLKLEVVGAQAGRLGEQRSKVFATEGGTIGRVGGNDWVLPDQFVSSRHALIQYADGQFYVVDTNSSNGVFLNAPNFRLEKGRPYPIKTGDRLLIDPFEIHVSVIESALVDETPDPALADSPETLSVARTPPGAPARQPAPSSDPFAVEEEVPFIGTVPAPASREALREDSLIPRSSDRAAEEAVDPLVALGLPNTPKAPPPPRVEDLARGSPLRSSFEPPRIVPSRSMPPEEIPESPPAAERTPLIPADYNPLAQTSFERQPKPEPRAAPRRPAPPAARDARADYRRAAEPPSQPRDAASRPAPRAPAPVARAPQSPAAPPAGPRPAPGQPAARAAPARAPAPQPPTPRATPPAPRSPAPRGVSATPPPPPPAPAPAPAPCNDTLDFAALLAAAGLEGVPVTKDLASSFGSILKCVVDGLRDVLRAREELKDQFRLRITTYAPRENNPIKFSANTEDALHNLLVKHNPAYLEPVAAFEAAFDDLRIHQMAMLAGMRAGYQAMLSAFDPDQLEQKFERYAKRGGLLGGAAKQRYWEMYRDIFKDTLGDADASFRTLFGAAFAEGYEEQARLLKGRTRGQ